MSRKRRLSLDEYEQGVVAGDRAVLAQAITLIESRDPADGALAQELLARLMPRTGHARRVGISGPPGVGKSTFIDALGMRLVDAGKRVAVLAIDPSSALSGGSILGDKTRMARLAMAEAAFIRPSPSGLTLGGVARRTREAMLVCEAAGFDVVLIETVGVGQSETAVADMVDCFLVLAQPGAGDELQGIKKGILELADAICVNKADGEHLADAGRALADLKAALRYLPARSPAWRAEALLCSGLTGAGLDAVWDTVERQRAALEAAGELATRRAEQQRRWMWAMIEERLMAAFRAHPAVAARLAALEAEVRAGRVPATAAATELLALFGAGRHED
jgi:LAO/AO transport system kinase